MEGFWEGFGRPKSMIFVIFSIKNVSKKLDELGKAKKNAFWSLKSKLRTKCGGPCGSGGRNKRMGEGLGARNLKPNSESRP